MAKIPLPERGQPIDVSYIYQITNAVNELSDQISTTGDNSTRIDVPAVGPKSVKTSETKILGGRLEVRNNSTQAADSTVTFDYPYTGFKYAPVVTATILNTGGVGTAGDAATVVLTSVTTSGVSGLIRFDKAGIASTTVNLIIIGIPN
jgi:hypothetical protein